MANDTPKTGGAPKAAEPAQNGPATKGGPAAAKDIKTPNSPPLGGATAHKDTGPPKTEKAPQEGKKSNGFRDAAPAKPAADKPQFPGTADKATPAQAGKPTTPAKTDKAAPAQAGKPPAPAKADKATPAQTGKPTTPAKADKAAPAQEGKPAPPGKGKKAAPAKDSKTPATAKAGKATPAKAAKAPAQPEPSLEEKRAKMEAELRKQFNIPKSDKPVEPWVAPKVEKVVRIPHDEIHPFKGHTFIVDTKAPKFLALTASIRARGVGQPAVVRPRADGGYEMVSGHRRDAASIAADIAYTPCIVRALNDEQAIQQMVEDNLTGRDVSTMELAHSLKKQLDSIKRQGAHDAIKSGTITDATAVGTRSNAIIAERNGMSVKQVQRHIALTKLIPPLQEYLDEGKAVDGGGKPLKIAFVTAVELSALKPISQELLSIAIEGEQATPSGAQAKLMVQMDKDGVLNADAIDSIMHEEKKEVGKVILSGAELEKYFGKDKTPTQMKDMILEALDKQYPPKQLEAAKGEKKPAQQEK